MNEPDTYTEPPSAERSLIRMAAGILLRPGPVFEELRDTPPYRPYWLVPLILYIVTATICTQIVVSLPGPSAHLRILTEKEFLPRLEEFVREGTMTRQQTEWLRLFITPGTGQFFFTQFAGTLFAATGALILLAFFLWQLGRSVLARAVPYKKVLEVVGLTFTVGTIERIVSTTLIAATGSLYATPGPGLLLLGNPESKAFLILSSINLCTLWEIGVAGVGLSRVYERDLAKVLVLLLALWLLWTGVMLFPVLFIE
jgi:hypothetical protein